MGDVHKIISFSLKQSIVVCAISKLNREMRSIASLSRCACTSILHFAGQGLVLLRRPHLENSQYIVPDKIPVSIDIGM